MRCEGFYKVIATWKCTIGAQANGKASRLAWFVNARKLAKQNKHIYYGGFIFSLFDLYFIIDAFEYYNYRG